MQTSRDLATQFNKRHSGIMRDIRAQIKRGILSDVKESTYQGTRRKEKQLELTDEQYNLMVTKYAMGATNLGAYEKQFGSMLLEFIDGDYEVLTQYTVGTYRLDFYIPELNLAIEYDEYAHKFQTVEDNKRQTYIENKIGATFVRVKQDEEIKGLRKVSKYL